MSTYDLQKCDKMKNMRIYIVKYMLGLKCFKLYCSVFNY